MRHSSMHIYVIIFLWEYNSLLKCSIQFNFCFYGNVSILLLLSLGKRMMMTMLMKKDKIKKKIHRRNFCAKVQWKTKFWFLFFFCHVCWDVWFNVYCWYTLKFERKKAFCNRMFVLFILELKGKDFIFFCMWKTFNSI